MGGSLVRTLSDSGRTARVWSPDPLEVEAASALPGIEGASSVSDAVAGSECVVVAVPLSALEAVLSEVVPAAQAVEWVQDVASLQRPPLEWAGAASLGGRYVSAHPMAGGEASGFSASRKDLYQDAPVWLSHEGAASGVREGAEAFWRELGAHPAWTDADEHDRRMAAVSHLPQVVATHLATVIAGAGLAWDELGPGGRDTTRLAGSDPRMWTDILTLAGGRVAPHLRELAHALQAEADRLEAGDASAFAEALERTRTWRAS
jgi:prephenate dehydrogenase